MKEPTRWVNGHAPAEVLELLRAGLEESPSDRCLKKTLTAVSAASLGLSVAVTAKAAVVGTTTPGVSGSIALLFGKTVVISLLTSGAVLSTVAAVQHYRTAKVTDPSPLERRNSAPRSIAREAVVTAKHDSAPVIAAISSASELPIVVEEHRQPVNTAPPAPSARRIPLDTKGSFAEEVAFLDQMRSDLRTGDARSTLVHVSEYERRSDFGHFVPEALYLRMEAYRKLGNTVLAQQTAQTIIQRFPQSAQARGARILLESDDTATQR